MQTLSYETIAINKSNTTIFNSNNFFVGFGNDFKFHFIFFQINQPVRKHMTIVITKNMKCKWYKITSFLFNFYFTSFMSRSSVFTSQMTVNTNFIRNNFFFTKSANIVFSLIFFIIICHNDICFSVLKIESHFTF